jgi:hypothetical protein
MTPPITVRFEMGCVVAEFHRLLPLVAPVTFDAARRRFTHTEPDRCWHLCILAERERRIALVRLPVVDVAFVFEGYARAEADAVLDRFWSYFRRGGG